MRAARARVFVAPAGLNDSSLHELHVERDGDLVTDENSTCFQRGVPVQAEVFTVNLSCSRQADASISPRILGRRSRSLNGEDNITSDAVNGKVARHRVFAIANSAYARGFQRELRKLLDVEEVGAHEMCITLGI